MKKVSLFFGSMLIAMTAFGQASELKETVVESPRFDSSTASTTQMSNQKAPIYSYLQSKLCTSQYLDKVVTDGVVVIAFTVEPTGELSNCHVQNSVTKEMDNCVMTCLNETSGHWLPGKVNGNAVAMESKVYVRFVIPGNPDHEQLARTLTAQAVKKFEKGEKFEDALATNKATRQYKKSVNYLNTAARYSPEEYAIVFWQACVYEKLGDLSNKELKLKELDNLLATNPKRLPIEMAEIYALAK